MLQLALFAPDWTISNINILAKVKNLLMQIQEQEICICLI